MNWMVSNMLELKLDDTYRIVADKLNFSLEKYENVIDLKSKLPTGEKQWKNKGYFGNRLDYALKVYVTESLRDKGESEVHNLLDRMNELEKVIKKQVKKENIVLVSKGSKEDE